MMGEEKTVKKDSKAIHRRGKRRKWKKQDTLEKLKTSLGG